MVNTCMIKLIEKVSSKVQQIKGNFKFRSKKLKLLVPYFN